jgi:general stress protein 26
MENKEMKELTQTIQSIKFGMLTTIGKDHKIHSRPMTTNEVEEEGYLWFFTSVKSELIKDISLEDGVQLSYAEPSKNIYISINGDAEIINSKEKKVELWNPMAKAWFPKGVEDPDLVLVRVKINEAEIWDSGASRILTLAKIVKAIFNEEKFENEDSHRVIKM